MRTLVSPQRRKELDALYGKVLRFLSEKSPGEFAPGEIATGIGIDHLTDRKKLNEIGHACQKMLKQGLVDWNGIIHKRRYRVEQRHIPDVDARLAAYDAHDELERKGQERIERTSTTDDGFAYSQDQVKAHRPNKRRW